MITIRTLRIKEYDEYRQILANISEADSEGTEQALTAEKAEGMIRELEANQNVIIIIAEFPDGCIYGYVLGFRFKESYLKRDFKPFEELGAKPNDYYYALIGVVPERRKFGVHQRLIEAMLPVHSKARMAWAWTRRGDTPLIETLLSLGFDIAELTDERVYLKRKRI